MKNSTLIGIAAGLLLTGCNTQPPVAVEAVPTRPISIVEKVVPEKEEPIELVEEIPVIEPIESTEFRVTAYCSCEKCCGKWASLRPLDENGNPIVLGASGEVLAPGISCASTYPFGTEINLDGIGTVIVEDRTADWVVEKYGENIVDIYFDDHQTALNFGLKYVEGVVLDGTPGY